jgi:hypothetical protein
MVKGHFDRRVSHEEPMNTIRQKSDMSDTDLLDLAPLVYWVNHFSPSSALPDTTFCSVLIR